MTFIKGDFHKNRSQVKSKSLTKREELESERTLTQIKMEEDNAPCEEYKELKWVLCIILDVGSSSGVFLL